MVQFLLVTNLCTHVSRLPRSSSGGDGCNYKRNSTPSTFTAAIFPLKEKSTYLGVSRSPSIATDLIPPNPSVWVVPNLWQFFTMLWWWIKYYNCR